MWGNTPNGVSGSGRLSAVVASLPFDPKIVAALEKDRTSELYSRWRPSNKRLHADQFSWSVFKSYSSLGVLLKFFNDQYNGKEDFGWGFDSISGEEGIDNSQQHSLVLDLVADDNVYITYESSAGLEYRKGSRHC